jgi:hypothetical protein
MPESEKIIKTEVRSWGHPTKDSHGEKCGSCEKLDNLIKSDISPNSSIPIDYSVNDIYTDEGRKYADEKKITEMPHTEVCDIYDSGRKDCKEIKGYDPKDFEYLKNRRIPEPQPEPKPEPTQPETSQV